MEALFEKLAFNIFVPYPTLKILTKLLWMQQTELCWHKDEHFMLWPDIYRKAETVQTLCTY